ncbi:hypothetical protein [Escherichia coli]|uniref:hypothetical protein n=1 Tax=Escherichia coli TaxID=562 RepID=UPI00391A7AE7
MPAIRVPRASGDKPGYRTAADVPGAVFPAPAGINRMNMDDEKIREGVPRASGDKPSARGLLHSVITCSPRQRG